MGLKHTILFILWIQSRGSLSGGGGDEVFTRKFCRLWLKHGRVGEYGVCQERGARLKRGVYVIEGNGTVEDDPMLSYYEPEETSRDKDSFEDYEVEADKNGQKGGEAFMRRLKEKDHPDQVKDALAKLTKILHILESNFQTKKKKIKDTDPILTQLDRIMSLLQKQMKKNRLKDPSDCPNERFQEETGRKIIFVSSAARPHHCLLVLLLSKKFIEKNIL